MESEKVKEIKKALEHCIECDCENCPRSSLDPAYEDECRLVLIKQILTLINELESENEKLKQHKRELQGGQQDLTRRIAELEKENAKLLDSVETVQNNRCMTKCELTKKALKQFAERLNGKLFDLGNVVTEEDIEETLKEVINEK